MVTGGRQESCCSSGRRGRRGRGWSGGGGGGGGGGVGISLPVLCILWVTAWAQNSGPGPVNVARNLPESAYTQSSRYKSAANSGNAANGNTDGYYSENNCIHTGAGDFNPWWEVDLGKAYYIYNIRIWARDGYARRLYPFTITVDNTQCVYAPQRSGDRSITVNCSQPLRGQVVRITREYTRVWDYQLNMCEFQIFVCNPGYYGVDCNLRCNDHCSSEGCFMNNGTCINCKRGTYGLNCSQQCGQCRNRTYCDREDGSCSSCAAGWQMPLCQEECEDGSYGINCREKCGHCKDGAVCDKETGDCLLCEPGWYPHKCQTPCQDGWYGLNCGQRCGRCLNNAACNKTNGYCPCPVGKQPPLCDKDCQDKTYGQDCREKCGHCREGSVCDPVTGHCPQGCQPGWMDNTGLSVHQCDTACPAGLYGVQCNQTCGHCQSDSQCHHVSGECLQGCAEGFTGTHCTTDEESDSGPWYIYVVIVLATLVVVLLVVVAAVVWRSRRTRASGPGEGTHDGRNQPGHIESRPQECSSQRQEEGLHSEIEDASLQQTDQRKAEEDDDGQYIDVDQVSDPPVHASGTRAALLTTPAAAPLKRPPAGGQAAADGPKKETPGGRAYPAKNPPKAGGGGSPPGRQPAVQQPVQAAGDISLATFSKPAHQLDADSSEEPSGQRQATYDKAAVYENTREVPKIYEKLQTCSEGMYESYGEAEV
ncbi:uncharacterized protein LOC143285267 [Babylonia areolata]|uniref:uncharacterized protein LOC143285267 n=1 Tax=Babylonia areolata TaxID=304850 RepID=UPI003FD1E888